MNKCVNLSASIQATWTEWDLTVLVLSALFLHCKRRVLDSTNHGHEIRNSHRKRCSDGMRHKNGVGRLTITFCGDKTLERCQDWSPGDNYHEEFSQRSRPRSRPKYLYCKRKNVELKLVAYLGEASRPGFRIESSMYGNIRKCINSMREQ